jgi:hypothetical protein
MKYLIYPLIIFILNIEALHAKSILIPMDNSQKDHLKSYGIVYNYLKSGQNEIKWCLNYMGGSFLLNFDTNLYAKIIGQGITCSILSDQETNLLVNELKLPEVNSEVVVLNKFARIALYSPTSASPWDDAVSLALRYAEIPFEIIYDQDILNGRLIEFDWIHLHHEDFTGQMGKMYTQKDQSWYQNQLNEDRSVAKSNGFSKVSQLKNKITLALKSFIIGGGYLFAMCTATDTFDISLATTDLDIVESSLDGDPISNNVNNSLKYQETLAFTNFNIYTNPRVNEFSDIDASPNFSPRKIQEEFDYFELNDFSSKNDLIPTMLNQNHEKIIHGFMGQTTSFLTSKIKPNIIILAENQKLEEVKYLYGTAGKGFFCFLGGHDPEDYQHFVNEEHTDLGLHKNSPGYRLILNNILFPSAQKKKQKT